MSTKIYLSPSSQSNNQCSGGDTEAQHCRKIAESAKKYLEKNGFKVKLADVSLDVSGRVKDSNKWGADVHIPVHTNAGGGDGTLVMCYTGCSSNKYVKNVYNTLASVSPGKDDGIKARTDLAEITETKAMCVYVECEFHDTYGSWIDKNTDALGKAIAKGICNAEGKSFTDATVISKPTGSGSTGLYKVQGGAFSEKKNAEDTVKELKAKGFDGYAYQSGNLYKVQAGAFQDETNAEALASKLASAGFNTYVYKD